MLGLAVVVVVTVVVGGGILVAAAVGGDCGGGVMTTCQSPTMMSFGVIKDLFAVLDVVAADGYEDVMTRKKRETLRRQQRESPQTAIEEIEPTMETQRHLVPLPSHQHHPATASLATQSTFAE